MVARENRRRAFQRSPLAKTTPGGVGKAWVAEEIGRGLRVPLHPLIFPSRIHPPQCPFSIIPLQVTLRPLPYPWKTGSTTAIFPRPEKDSAWSTRASRMASIPHSMTTGLGPRYTVKTSPYFSRSCEAYPHRGLLLVHMHLCGHLRC